MAMVKAISLGEIPSGKSKNVNVNGKLVAIYHVSGKVYATSGVCLHAGGPMGDGTLEGNIITCPWHGWQYDITTGANQVMPAIKLKTFKTEIKGNDIFVDV